MEIIQQEDSILSPNDHVTKMHSLGMTIEALVEFAYAHDCWELPTNIKGNPSIRQSSFWRDVQNGNPARICGSVHGNNALVFQGQLKRYAETVDLNIEYGANISFGFKFGGYVNSRQEPTHPACRGALRTPVSVRWSNDYGLSWNDLKFKTVTGGQVMITSFDETYVTEFMNNVTSP